MKLGKEFLEAVANMNLPKPQTNADRIRQMTDEELAEFLWQRDIQIVERASKAAGFNYHYNETECIHNIKDWLKAPVDLEAGK